MTLFRGEARSTIWAATSSTDGQLAWSASGIPARFAGVSITDGMMALTRIPSGASSSAAFAKADRSSSRLALPGSKSPASPVAYSAESSNPFGAAPSGGGGFGRGSSSWNGASDQSHRPEPPTAYAYHDEEYYCRTAREIREACENGGREPERYDFCLSFGGYYGNSRFCGYHP